MPIFDVQKYNSVQSDEMLKIYTPEMYDKEWEQTESLEKELFDLLYENNEIELEKFVNETEPLATFEYISGTFNNRYIDADTRFIEGIPILPVRTLKRVRKQLTDKINILKLKNNI